MQEKIFSNKWYKNYKKIVTQIKNYKNKEENKKEKKQIPLNNYKKKE